MDTTTPPPAEQPAYPPPAPAPQRSGSDGFFDAMRRMGIVRTQDRWIGGVAGGIAQRFGIDPLLVRGIFGITVFFGGLGLIIYGLGWALLPEQSDGRIHLQETLRGHFDAALLGAIGMFIVGISRGDGWFGWWDNNGFGWVGGLLWFAAIATLVALVIAAANGRHRKPPSVPQGPWTGAPYAPTGPAATGSGAPVPPAPAATYAAPASYSGPTASGYATPPAGGYASSQPGGYAGPPAGGYAGPPATYFPPPPPLPAIPPLPRKAPVYGPGAAAVGAVVGLTLVTLAVLLIAERQEGSLNLEVGLTAAGVGIVLAGLGIIVAGLRGRKSGTLGFLAIVGIVLAVPAATFTQGTWSDGSAENIQLIASDSEWTPTTADQAREGIGAGVGDLNVDLTRLTTTDGTVRVPISLGAGDMTVTVPADTAVAAEIRLAAGDIRWDVDDPQQISGVTGSRGYDFESTEVTNGASPTLVLQIEQGAGEIRVVEEDR